MTDPDTADQARRIALDGLDEARDDRTGWYELLDADELDSDAISGHLTAIRGHIETWQPTLNPELAVADYERRGGIEQRAREVAEANTSSPTKNPIAIRAARYILGETS